MHRFGSVSASLAAAITALLLTVCSTAADDFARRWTFVSESSAVIYWQLDDISRAAVSWVEYGPAGDLSDRTQTSAEPRWSQFHRLTGLRPDTEYSCRMVVADAAGGEETRSETLTFTTGVGREVVRVPGDLPGPPYVLDQPDTYYLLTRDVTTPGTAFDIAAGGVTLDLDGHTVTFGDDTAEQVYGVRFSSQIQDRSVLCNGRIVQGARSREYSAAVGSISRPRETEVFGIETDVHLKCAYPLHFTAADRAEIHHNHFYSRVTEIENRHYPGNSLLRIETLSTGARTIRIRDNLLTEGCHWGIVVRPEADTCEIHHNDIRHHQQYVNGYAVSPAAGAEVHHNRIASTGRGIHISRPDVTVRHNFIDTRGHMHLSDLPAGTRPFHHRLIELHGIKLEGRRPKNCKVFGNFVRITQHPPADSGGAGDPRNKVRNGVYVRSSAGRTEPGTLVDDTRQWEHNRWRLYFVKYHPDLPPAMIDSNDAHTLFASGIESAASGEYSIYMKWQYVPPTPLNIACYDPDAGNEVYGNTFIGITHYSADRIRHGDYGDTGNWATGIMMVGMNRGPAQQGEYSAWVHDNEFFSNDLFINSYNEVDMTVRIEDNAFRLVGEPHVVERGSRIRGVGEAFERLVREAGNRFVPEPSDAPVPPAGVGAN